MAKAENDYKEDEFDQNVEQTYYIFVIIKYFLTSCLIRDSILRKSKLIWIARY